MYIRKSALASIYKLMIGAVALVLVWCIFGQQGWPALRLFPTWVLILTALYFLASALFLAIQHERDPGKNLAPVFEGMILMGYLFMIGISLLSVKYQFYMPELPTWIVVFICLLLPLMVLADWIFFVKKGRWKIMASFYWLALPATYVATMIFTAAILPDTTKYLYPLEILNYNEFGLFAMLKWLWAVTVIELLVGYLFYLIDFVASGKLSKYIVLPHIHTIVVEDEGTEVQKQIPEQKVPNNDAKIKHSESQNVKSSISEVEIVEVSREGETKARVKTSAKRPNSKTFAQKVHSAPPQKQQPKPQQRPQKAKIKVHSEPNANHNKNDNEKPR